jgi:hypothetical protein
MGDNYEVARADKTLTRDQMVPRAQIARMKRAIDAKETQYDSNDDISTELLVRKLAEEETVLIYKPVGEIVPEDSYLKPDTFFLVLQTKTQRELAARYGNAILFVDGTHNLTTRANLVLHTILARDEHGHGKLISYFKAY